MAKKKLAETAPVKVPPRVEIVGNSFTAVQWDAKAVAAIQTVADALLAQAHATKSLIDVFTSQNIEIKTMLHIDLPRVDAE